MPCSLVTQMYWYLPNSFYSQSFLMVWQVNIFDSASKQKLQHHNFPPTILAIKARSPRTVSKHFAKVTSLNSKHSSHSLLASADSSVGYSACTPRLRSWFLLPATWPRLIMVCEELARQPAGHQRSQQAQHLSWISGNTHNVCLCSANKAPFCGFETKRRHHKKSKKGIPHACVSATRFVFHNLPIAYTVGVNGPLVSKISIRSWFWYISQ